MSRKFERAKLPVPVDILRLPCCGCGGLCEGTLLAGRNRVPVCHACRANGIDVSTPAAADFSHKLDLLIGAGHIMPCAEFIAIRRREVFGE